MEASIFVKYISYYDLLVILEDIKVMALPDWPLDELVEILEKEIKERDV